MNAVERVLDQAAPTAAAKQAAKDSEPPTRGQGETELVKEFKEFLKDLKERPYTPDAALEWTLGKFCENIGYDEDIVFDSKMQAPLFYQVFDDEVDFIWPSGLLLKVRLWNRGTWKNPDWIVGAWFDHLARAEVYEG